MIFFQIFYLLNCRSFQESFLRIGVTSNPWIFVGIGTTNAGDNEKLARSFRQHGYATVDLTHDEIAAALAD